MYKLDLHCHSYGSHDGGLSLDDIRQALVSQKLDVIAITDHDTIEAAQQIKTELGDKIIIGQEITTSQGEIIGLYLSQAIQPQQSALETAKAIKEQGGLVYIPHPFDRHRRSGVSLDTLESIQSLVDIIETGNGRDYLTKHARQAHGWAKRHKVAMAHSSDAHGPIGWGKTYSIISQPPTSENLARQLQKASYRSGRVGLIGLLYPALNRWRNRRG